MLRAIQQPQPADLALYRYDGSLETAPPNLVAFPSWTEGVTALAKIASEFKFRSRAAVRELFVPAERSLARAS
jgi:hypothetical protein